MILETSSLPADPSDLEVVKYWIAGLERLYGTSKAEAWKLIADKARISSGAVEGIARDRVKDVSTRVFRALQQLVEDELTKAISRMQRDLQLSRSKSLGSIDLGSFEQAAAALTSAWAALHLHH